MKRTFFYLLIVISSSALPHIGFAQVDGGTPKQQKEIRALIDQYSLARENRDTILLRKILTKDVDQLVSSGEWRNGIQASVTGMLKSSASTPGTRTLQVHKIRFIDVISAIVDCKYDIQNPDATIRRMWSTFIVVNSKNEWKISAIRNMLPAAQ